MPTPTVYIESVDLEGRGVTHLAGKAIFIDNALPGEQVSFRSYQRKSNYEFAQAVQRDNDSFMRDVPRCVYFGRCGGCSMQHLDFRSQVAIKQRVLEDTLWHISRLRADRILPAIYGLPWGYRYKARLAARYVEAKQSSLIGFHEKNSSFIADMRSCEILPERISQLLGPLRDVVSKLSIRAAIPQVEIAIGDQVDIFVMRILEPMNENDEELLKAFAKEHTVQLWLQPKGPDSAYPFYPVDAPLLYYALPEFDVKLFFLPTDFTQVNPEVNRILVRQAISLLNPQSNERITDLFCGIGNFSLPIARYASEVIGIELNQALVNRATANAAANGLREKAHFLAEDLFEADANLFLKLGRFDKALIDPPREGAIEFIKALPADWPTRIVYVSCNPATLARDASVLVHQKAFRLEAAGIVNMFPHTSHVESIAVFDRGSA